MPARSIERSSASCRNSAATLVGLATLAALAGPVSRGEAAPPAAAAPTASPATMPATAPVAAPAGLTVGGDVEKPQTFSPAALAAMPHQTLRVKDHDGSDAAYDGVPLRDLLAAAGVLLGQHRTRGPQLAKFVLATSADGYHVVFALAELDADYAEKNVIVADRRNGQPLDAKTGPLRLVVPGEGMQGRWSRMLVSVDVRSAASGR